MAYSVHPVDGLPAVEPGMDLAALLGDALAVAPGVASGDILVVCQKVVSKAEGRIVDLRTVVASPFAVHVAGMDDKDPRLVEVILRESRRIVRMAQGHLIVETGPGWICANAGVDASNAGLAEHVVLLPRDPDLSAAQLRRRIGDRFGCDIAVIISDTFGRPWRLGQMDVALGVAGMSALHDFCGQVDRDGRTLQHTVLAHADALAAAAGLVMGKAASIPAALIRGYSFAPHDGSGRELIRDADLDLFR